MSDPLARLCSNSPLHYYPGIKCKVHEIKRNSHKCERLLIVKQILLVSTKGNVMRRVNWRI